MSNDTVCRVDGCLGSHVDDETDECIVWPFAMRDGYGKLTIDGREDCAHVFACERHHGPRPIGGWWAAAHAPIICHNRSCFNHRHLMWATYAENNAHKKLDGTNTRPPARSNVKLTRAQADEIRQRSSTETRVAIALAYGVSPSTVSLIARGMTWRSP